MYGVAIAFYLKPTCECQSDGSDGLMRRHWLVILICGALVIAISMGVRQVAGLFLRHFVGRTGDEADAPRIPWVHLDIAGVGMNKGGGFGYTDKGPTAATVRSLIRFVTTEES